MRRFRVFCIQLRSFPCHKRDQAHGVVRSLQTSQCNPAPDEAEKTAQNDTTDELPYHAIGFCCLRAWRRFPSLSAQASSVHVFQNKVASVLLFQSLRAFCFAHFDIQGRSRQRGLINRARNLFFSQNLKHDFDVVAGVTSSPPGHAATTIHRPKNFTTASVRELT